MSILAVLLFVASFTVGCESYRLEGRVIDGEAPAVVVVDADDPRLARNGLANVRIDAMLDPDTNPQRLPAILTQDDGTFSAPVDATGAGFLEYELFVAAQRRGFKPTQEVNVPLPGAGKKLLIVMVPGRGEAAGFDDPFKDLWRESERYEKQFE